MPKKVVETTPIGARRIVVVTEGVVSRVVEAPTPTSPELGLRKGELAIPHIDAKVGWRMNTQMILNPPGDA